MLVLLCALINIVQTKDELEEAVTHSEKSFKALCCQTNQHELNASLLIDVVKSKMYDISQWKYLAESYLKYMNGDRFEYLWAGSDWWASQACEEHTSSVCEDFQPNSKYCGPKRK